MKAGDWLLVVIGYALCFVLLLLATWVGCELQHFFQS